MLLMDFLLTKSEVMSFIPPFTINRMPTGFLHSRFGARNSIQPSTMNATLTVYLPTTFVTRSYIPPCITHMIPSDCLHLRYARGNGEITYHPTFQSSRWALLGCCEASLRPAAYLNRWVVLSHHHH